jgi:hypothetical protein
MSKARTLAKFEETHGAPKIKALEKRLATERAKVEALADVQGRMVIERRKENRLLFALTGDRHTGSLYQHTAALSAFYEFCKEEGVECVYDAGDILAGHNVYRGQEFELRDLGFEAQLNRLRKDAPRNVPTRFITGNHDASFKNACGVSVGKSIEEAVPEYHFLGEDQARVRFDTPNGSYTLGLIHPGGGSSYALSYRPQKIIESLEGGTKPNMLAIGHHHKAEMMPTYRNVCGVQVGTFERQTPFMARQGLAAHVGGWIVEVYVGEGHNRIKGEFVAVYV